MEKRYLYLMISHTDTGMGQMIRFFSRYPYNHVSLSLDPAFRHWVGFARYVVDAPMFGGLTYEPAERFLAKGIDPTVRIFRLEINEEKYVYLKRLFTLTDRIDSGLIYNYLDAPASLLGIKVRIPGAYTCLGFASKLLDKPYLSIKALNLDLDPYAIYEGPLTELAGKDSGDRSAPYFARMGFWRATGNTLRHWGRLIRRIFDRGYVDIVRKV